MMSSRSWFSLERQELPPARKASAEVMLIAELGDRGTPRRDICRIGPGHASRRPRERWTGPSVCPHSWFSGLISQCDKKAAPVSQENGFGSLTRSASFLAFLKFGL